ncbi:hypothetical protein E4T56_gene12324 [Termitomyces sp. T112]|nr:hypothetical protein E4T56_gene12324 [Termitomyces sp. T112]
MISNYFGKRLYIEHIKKWHRLNPGQIITGRLFSNANPDPEQAAMQQLLIHKVMQQDITTGQALSKEEWIKALECELFALRQSGKKFDGVQVPHVAYQPANDTPKAAPLTSNTLATSSPSNLSPAPATKPADKGKAPECTVANEQPPITKEPITQPPIHLFSGNPGHYVPPTNRNFAAPNRSNNGTYQTMPPIYNIEQSKVVFEQVLSTKVTVLVGKLCSVSQDIRNHFRTAFMPKQLVDASANTVQDPSNIFEDILLTFAIEGPQFLLGSNTNTTNGLTSDKAPFASVDPIEAYINSLPHGEEPVVLTVTKDSQSLRSVMMLINNKEEVECIHNSGSQIISMSAEIASDLGLSYDPNIILNMQSANGTMDQSLGLAQNVPCTIGDIMHNHLIPPGLEKEVCEIICNKISAGIYEPSNSTYCLRWFCVLKKNGKLRIVHSFKPLNHVTICHSGVPPSPDHVAESFAGCICGTTLNLYVGYNEQLIDPASHDLMTFQTLFSALRLVTLLMGWTNSVPIFHNDITFILQPEIPHNMLSFINDVGAKGPKDWKIV